MIIGKMNFLLLLCFVLNLLLLYAVHLVIGHLFVESFNVSSMFALYLGVADCISFCSINCASSLCFFCLLLIWFFTIMLKACIHTHSPRRNTSCCLGLFRLFVSSNLTFASVFGSIFELAFVFGQILISAHPPCELWWRVFSRQF